MGRQTQATARRAAGDPPRPTEPQVDGPAEAAQARRDDLTPGRQPGADRSAEHLGSRLAQPRPAAPECDCHPWHPGWDAVSLIGSRPGTGNSTRSGSAGRRSCLPSPAWATPRRSPKPACCSIFGECIQISGLTRAPALGRSPIEVEAEVVVDIEYE